MKKIREFLFTNGSTKQTVVRNSFWRFSAVGFLKSVRFLAVVLAARWLGPEVFGSYSYAISLATIVFIFSEWGINVLFTRDAQGIRANVNEVFSSALVLKTIITAISLLAGIILCLIVTDVSSYLVLLAVLTFAIGNIRELFIAVMVAKQRSELETLTVFFEGLITIGLIATLFYFQRTAEVFMSISLLAIVTGLIVSGFLIFHFLKIRVTSVTTNSLKALFKEGFPLALFGVVGYIFFTSDQLFIKHFLGVESLGYYSFATRIIYTLILVPTMLTSVIFPIFARKLAEKVNVRKIFNNVTGGLAILGAIFAIIILFGNNLFLFVAPQYEASLPVLTVLGGLLVVLFPSIWLDYVLIAVRKQKQNFLITLSAAILNIFLNFIFIPYFGIIGAAYATILSQLFNVAMTYCYASLILKRQNAIEAQPITTVNL